jgi:hypothetical protein
LGKEPDGRRRKGQGKQFPAVQASTPNACICSMIISVEGAA